MSCPTNLTGEAPPPARLIGCRPVSSYELQRHVSAKTETRNVIYMRKTNSWRTPSIFLKPVINMFEAMKTNPVLVSARTKKVMCCQYSRNEGEVKGHVLSAAEAVNSCTQPVFKAALLSLHNREVAGRDFIRLKAKTMFNSKPRLSRHKTTTLRSNSPNYMRNNQRALILA